MTDIPEKSYEFDTTEGLLYRALCVLIERSHGHVEISLDDLETVGGRFVMGAGDGTLILSTCKGDDDVEH